MYYVTKRASPRHHQMTLEELFYEENPTPSFVYDNAIGDTVTRTSDKITPEMRMGFNIPHATMALAKFNADTEPLREKPRHDLYREFYIPKRSGGLRKIDAPNDELMNALRQLKMIFESEFGALHHTSAFAYVHGRSTIDAVKRHQKNESKWFAKFDLSNFFGSTTKEFVMSQLEKIYPFCMMKTYKTSWNELDTAIDLCFLDGGLPQGTPISPMLTNIVMIPIDFALSNELRSFNRQTYVYTRYADDFIISSRYNFRFKDVEGLINEKLSEFSAPFSVKPEKTRYGSSCGSNWNLGVMLNKDNQITVGYKNKKRFESMVNNYLRDRANGVRWDKHDIMVLDGYRAYYTMVEGDSIGKIVSHIGEKYHVDPVKLIKQDLNAN